MKTVYISIGNSDDKLTQEEWAGYCMSLHQMAADFSNQIFGVWYSLPNSEYQNMCIAFSYSEDDHNDLIIELDDLRKHFNQTSIAFAEVPETKFIGVG